ncbi:thioesterase II family protein [Streptacidiphilus sp. P02-A3a]|uniref:thioesterase II family protein n=1 Tax=Streptacidiphilus sp. P02-A3a TaxID=2704468 RepID=UPI0015F95066|nr:alpha/beta fold hydrolase [Streptacidiphilus sp. P02-A3a]QMU70033.1 thioesterase [Streptacidiphilus sp. P02-A3a]
MTKPERGTVSLRRFGPPAAADDPPTTPLVCFPYAGGGATAFACWRRELPAWLGLYAHVAPGREERGREAPLRTVAELVADVLPDLLALPGPPVLVGHSFGAYLCYELAHRLTLTGRPPAQLVVLASGAPGLTALRPVGTDQEIEQLWRSLGADPAGLARPEFRERFFPVLRADLGAHAGFRTPPSRPRLTMPVSVLYGDQDPVATAAEAEKWRLLCDGPFQLAAVPGGHFFPQTRTSATLSALVRTLDPPAAPLRRPASTV